jgi:hypothetical protein
VTDPATQDSTATDTTATESTKPTGSKSCGHRKGQPAERTNTQTQSNGGGLTGGIFGSVGAILGSTVNTTVGTVGGLAGSLSHTVLVPVGLGTGSPTQQDPVLPDLNGLLPGWHWPSSGDSPGGGTVTVAVPEMPVDSAPAIQPQPLAPEQSATPDVDVPAPIVRTVAGFSTVGLRAGLRAVHQNARESPDQSDKHAGAPSGGGSGGGGLPSTPSTPMVLASVNAGHDHSGGARQPLAVLGSNANTTPLRLIGTSLDHEVTGARRVAGLPRTSPD